MKNGWLNELRVFANRSTFHRRRAEAMGWTFRDVDLVMSPNDFGLILKLDFMCVCGRLERFHTAIDELVVRNSLVARETLIDPVRQLYEHGSFSRKHLLEDGFDPEFIDKVLKIEREYRE